MSEFAIKVKGYFDNGLWSLSRVEKALELKKITQEEFDNITKSPTILPDDFEVESETDGKPETLPEVSEE